MTRAASRATRNEPAGHHVVLEVPVVDGRLEQRLRDRQPGVVDDDVDAAEREHARRRTAARDLRLVGDVAGDADGDVRAADLARRRPARCSASMSATTTQAPSAASRWAIARPMPDPRAGHERDPRRRAAWACGSRGASPPRAPSTRCGTSRPRDRRVRRQRLGAAHDVDRVDVELAGDPGGLLVLAEAEHADARARGRSPGRRRASPASRASAWRS